MALFKITVKSSGTTNGIKLEKGMSVEVVSNYSSPISTNGGHEFVDAFDRKYGIDIKKAGGLSSTKLSVEKI